MESHWSILTKQPPPLLSEQQLVDCANAFGNAGCDGGLPSQAFEYIQYNGGLTSESQYPYTAKDGPCVSKETTMEAMAPRGAANITMGAETDISRAIYYAGPVSIAYHVADDFMHYSDGIYDNLDCPNSNSKVNHAVLAVGYGTQTNTATNTTQQYWIVKNSWGTEFGMDGYFWINRGNNTCGLADCASWPLVGYSLDNE
jgi:cathepsin H